MNPIAPGTAIPVDSWPPPIDPGAISDAAVAGYARTARVVGCADWRPLFDLVFRVMGADFDAVEFDWPSRHARYVNWTFHMGQRQ